MLRVPWMIACLVLPACHSGAAPRSPAPSSRWDEVWVDAARSESGDGSRARPYRSVLEALTRRTGGASPWVHLAPGRYPGPLVLPAGGRLEGEGAVLSAEGEAVVVTASGGGELRGVEVEGGGWGLVAQGGVRVEGVRFHGQRQGAVRMGTGALTVTEGRFEAGGAEAVGVRGEGGGVRIERSAFEGDFHRAVEARGARVNLKAVRVHGARMGLHQSEGEARLEDVTVESEAAGREPGLFVHHASLWLEGVRVSGHEYGLQTREVKLRAVDFQATRSSRAGLALLATTGRLERTRVVGSGDFGAMSLLGSDLELSGVVVSEVESYGISATRGRLRLKDVDISRVRSREGDAGDGLHLRDVEVEARALTVRDVAGVGVLAAQGARVVLRGATLTACRTAGVWSETQARVTAGPLTVRGSQGPALVAMVDGGLGLEELTAEDNAGGLVAADCAGDTRVRLGRVKGQGRGADVGACVTGPSP